MSKCWMIVYYIKSYAHIHMQHAIYLEYNEYCTLNTILHVYSLLYPTANKCNLVHMRFYEQHFFWTNPCTEINTSPDHARILFLMYQVLSFYQLSTLKNC